MPMNHSIKTDEWIAAVTKANPIRTMPDGNILTCPVRLTHMDLLEPQKPDPKEAPDPNKVLKYGCAILFPPGVEGQIQSVIRPACENLARATFKNNVDPATGEISGIHFPLRKQDEKIDQQGFTRGCAWTRVTTKFKPRIVDPTFNDIENPEKRLYHGVWALVSINPYQFNNPKKRGISLGLQMVMLFSDDTKLVSAKADPAKAFAGVQIDSSFDAGAAFGQPNPTPSAEPSASSFW